MGSKKYSVSVGEFKEMGGHLLIIVAGAAMTYISQWVSQTDWGAWNGIVVPFVSGAIKFISTYLPDTSK